VVETLNNCHPELLALSGVEVSKELLDIVSSIVEKPVNWRSLFFETSFSNSI